MTILIIEDSVDVLSALKKGFKHEKIKTEHCKSGAEALMKLREKEYDMTILDLMLPDMRGELVLKQVKALDINTPLLILTANTDVRKKATLLNLGAEDFIQKPFTFEELYARIKAILRRLHNNVPTEYVQVGRLELLPDKRSVLLDGGEIRLQGKEYNLLEYLMKHPHQVVSRQTLMEKVWGYSASVLTNTVDAYMYKLRRKIDKGPGQKIIQTVHGIGFMLVCGGEDNL